LARRIHSCGAILVLLAAAGCAPPQTETWDDPVYQRLLDDHQEVDLEPLYAAAPEAIESAPIEQALSAKESLNLDEAITVAVVNHPRLRAAAYEIRKAEARELQARLGPNPEFEIEAEGLGSSEADWGETAFVFAQEFVTAGKLDKAGKVAQAEQLQSQAAFDAVKYELIARVKAAFHAVLAAEAELAARRELADLAATLLEVAEAQYRAGAAAEPDRLRFEVTHQRARVELHSAETAVTAARRALAGTMGVEMALDMPLAGDIDQLPQLPPADEITERVLAQSSRLDAAEMGIELARRAHELAEADAWPNFVAGAGPQYSDADDEFALKVVFGIGLPVVDRNQGAIAEALAERLHAGAELAEVRLELLDATATAWSVYESARGTAVAYRDSILPKAERTLDLTEQGYREGKFEYLRLLDAQQVYIETRIISIQALRDLHEAAAIIEGLMQTDRIDAPERAITGNGRES
jgi:cobalt-zinc-cadmium efflux system outer membrane protein